MVNRSKNAGTRWERQVRLALESTLDQPVARLVEGAVYDRGDLAFWVGETEFVIECRDRETMQVHNAAAKAKRKAGEARTIVVWKRKKLQPGHQVRTQVGEPVGIMPLGDLLAVLQRLNDLERRAANEEI